MWLVIVGGAGLVVGFGLGSRYRDKSWLKFLDDPAERERLLGLRRDI